MRILPVGRLSGQVAQKGFTYPIAILLVFVMAYGASHLQSQIYWESRRDLEAELLFRGQAYRNAIASYYNALPQKQLPSRLDDLVYDNRFLNPKRHIRELYPPIMADSWKLVYGANQKIIGVYIESEKSTMKKTGFDQSINNFENSDSYIDWRFVFIPD